MISATKKPSSSRQTVFIPSGGPCWPPLENRRRKPGRSGAANQPQVGQVMPREDGEKTSTSHPLCAVVRFGSSSGGVCLSTNPCSFVTRQDIDRINAGSWHVSQVACLMLNARCGPTANGRFGHLHPYPASSATGCRAPLSALPRGRDRSSGYIRAGSPASGRVCVSDGGCEPLNSASSPPHSGVAKQRRKSCRFWLARPTLATRSPPRPPGSREFAARSLQPGTVRIAG
jgi:hypothetical protein